MEGRGKEGRGREEKGRRKGMGMTEREEEGGEMRTLFPSFRLSGYAHDYREQFLLLVAGLGFDSN